MKLLIQKTNEVKGNIKKIELTSSDFENNTNTYVIKENESPIIYLTDTQSSYFIDDIDSKLERVNSETVAIITTDDLISLGGGTGGDSRPYKVYTALLTQTGTNAPVATVLENTLGETISFGYSSPGYYSINTTGEFPQNKTTFSIKNVINGTTVSSETYIGIFSDALNINTIDFTTLDDSNTAVNNILFNTPMEIRVYN